MEESKYVPGEQLRAVAMATIDMRVVSTMKMLQDLLLTRHFPRASPEYQRKLLSRLTKRVDD